MDLKNRRIVVIGGAGLIGSHTVDALLRTDVSEVVIYDNFARGVRENLVGALTDSRASLFDAGVSDGLCEGSSSSGVVT